MSRTRIALPNKGRLQQPTIELLRDAGLVFERGERTLITPVRNVALELLFVRTPDVVEMVTDGVAELGIVGGDLLAESESDLEVQVELGYGRCRLTAAVANGSPATEIRDLDGLRVATAHPRVTGRALAEHGVRATVIPLRGSVEAAPRLGLAEAVVDLVSSGSTLAVNGLRPIATLLESEAVLVVAPGSGGGIVSQVCTMLRAVVAGRSRRYVMMNAPRDSLDRIESLIPGLEAPSVIPLAHDGMVAVHSVVDADELWNLLPRLEEAGATGILVLPIEQLIP